MSIEPFFDRLDQCFDIEPAWMKGLENNRSIGVLWVAAYQLAMLYLHEHGENPSNSQFEIHSSCKRYREAICLYKASIESNMRTRNMLRSVAHSLAFVPSPFHNWRNKAQHRCWI